MSEQAVATIETSRLHELLPELLCEERRGLVRFLVHLAEFDRRRGWETLGYGNLWDYCARELRLQKGCVFRRTHTVTLLRRFPRVEQRLLSGALSMTTLLVLEKLLTEDNSEEILSLAEWKSKNDLEDLVAARMAPKAAPAPLVRKMPATAVGGVATMLVHCDAATAPVRVGAALTTSIADGTSTAMVGPVAVQPAPRHEARGAIDSTPLGDDRYLFRGVAGRAFREKLRRAQEFESHAVPDGDPIKVLERALDLLIEKHAKRVSSTPRVAKAKAMPGEASSKTTADAHPRTVPPVNAPIAPSSRKARPHIPIAVERAVRTRDGDCCAFLLADGSRCGSRWRIELDHILAFALGGESSEENLRVACRSHNSLHARRTFGEEHMTRSRRSSAQSFLRRNSGAPA